MLTPTVKQDGEVVMQNGSRIMTGSGGRHDRLRGASTEVLDRFTPHLEGESSHDPASLTPTYRDSTQKVTLATPDPSIKARYPLRREVNDATTEIKEMNGSFSDVVDALQMFIESHV